jgi:ribonuclease P protein component
VGWPYSTAAVGDFVASRLATLKIRADFLRVAADRHKAVMPGLVLQVARQPPDLEGGPMLRVGFTASRKVGNAVIRNRAKRRLRAAAAQILPVQGSPGTDYVLIARAATAERPYAALVADLAAALHRVEHGRAGHRPARRVEGAR